MYDAVVSRCDELRHKRPTEDDSRMGSCRRTLPNREEKVPKRSRSLGSKSDLVEDTLLTCWVELNGVELEIAWVPWKIPDEMPPPEM
ncbi:hypothetical protein EYF80_011084 [Liparis tanakae]|uniref:Uncharacterized protein n=1 Tax=Liparis tanakae TaxID=230148 RepID=A0A4Z2IKW0_9TELE|nr:hypothetical protein EYF80_011084 [Liparis tanakae]